MNKIFFFLLLIPFVGKTQTLQMNQSALIKYLVKQHRISSTDAKEIVSDQFFSHIYKIYLERPPFYEVDPNLLYYPTPQNEANTKKLINKVYDLNLINESTYEDILRKFNNRFKDHIISSKVISNEVRLFQYLSEKEYVVKTDTLVKYIDLLTNIGLIEKDISIEKPLTSKSDILTFVDKKLIIDKKTLPNSAEASYQFAFKQLKKIDPSLEISDLSFDIEEIKNEHLVYKSAVVRFQNSGVNYVSYNSYREEEDQLSLYEKLDRNFYRVFNKVLADQNSKFRIFAIERMDDQYLAFIGLTEEQFLILNSKNTQANYTYFDPHWYKIKVHDYFNPFTLLTLKETIHFFELYNSIGLFNHLTVEQKAKELRNQKENHLYSGESILYEITNTCLAFDWEMLEYDQPYKIAIEAFATITNNEFNPTNVKDDFSLSKRKATVSFDFNGKSYETIVDVENDWFDRKFLDLISAAIKENQLSGQFYDLPDGGQVSFHIYLTKEQYIFLSTNNLLEFKK